MLNSHKIYFPNLNGLRFIAAVLVIIHHIEQLKSLFNIPNAWDNPFILVAGKLGVILFFVLSGFLITYLLLEEEKQTGGINIKNFYVRRVLRIWPLYFLIIAIAFFILPSINFFHIPNLSDRLQENFFTLFIFFIFFIPNIALVMFPPVPYAATLWSVSVEEQFYIVWPIIFKWIKHKEFALYFIIISYLALKFGIIEYSLKHFFHWKVIQIFTSVWYNFSIDCMAIGGLFALYAHKQSKALTYISNKWAQIFILLLTTSLIGFGITIPYLHYEVYALLFSMIIYNLAVNPQSIINLEYKPLHYFGKISYGLYIFHPIAIVAIIKVLQIFSIQSNIAIYSLSILLTIAFSSFSYHYFELFFIKLKTKFSEIISGDNAAVSQ